MNAQAAIASPLALLRAPFPEHQISKLPKPYKRDSAKGKCNECGGYHGLPAVHLDYVGHAALTDRLLDADPEWTWEPLATDANGLPAYDGNRGLWIKLTVAGVTRLGYGSADGKQGGDAVKEMIGDALRNAAMRFGAALDLWHKGDLHLEPDEAAGGHSEEGAVSPRQQPNTLRDQLAQSVAEVGTGEPAPRKRENWGGRYPNKTSLHKALIEVEANLADFRDTDAFEAYLTTPEYQDFIAICEQHAPHYLEGGEPAPPEFKGIFAIEQATRDRLNLPDYIQAGADIIQAG